MAVSSRAVTVAATATRIDMSELGQASEGAAVYNAGSSTVYLGGSDVTTSNGYPLAAGEHIGLDLEDPDLLFGIVASGTVAVRVLEVGV